MHRRRATRRRAQCRPAHRSVCKAPGS
jgi:hypothetical protein